MTSLAKISCVIISQNAQSTIGATLDSLKDFCEVVIYSNNSTDNTEKIALTYSNVHLVKGDFLGFGPTKNLAASYAKNDWILSLDSDEIIPENLIEELKTLQLNDPKEVFILKRDNYFFSKEVKHSGWGDDFLTRIYNRSSHQFNDNMVHEFIVTDKQTKKTKLNNSFHHDAVQNLNQFLQKVIKYSDLAAQNKQTCSLFVVLAKAHFAFFKTYFLQLGFLDGWRGLVISISNFNGKFFRYMKRYINCKHK
jgi:glycosyltransferase involved in cell wall biosynthesis